MEIIARSISGAAILFGGIIFTLVGWWNIDGPGVLFGFVGAVLDVVGLFILVRIAFARQGDTLDRGFEVQPSGPKEL